MQRRRAIIIVHGMDAKIQNCTTLLYNSGVKVTASYARAHLPELLKAVQRGKTVTISRYNRPIADLAPSKQAQKPARRFGTLKGNVKIFDPNWAAPMTNDEADAFIEGRY
jgi:prevent-host-death family protein